MVASRGSGDTATRSEEAPSPAMTEGYSDDSSLDLEIKQETGVNGALERYKMQPANEAVKDESCFDEKGQDTKLASAGKISGSDDEDESTPGGSGSSKIRADHINIQ